MAKSDKKQAQVAIGSMLGRYEILSPLGEGAMAEVYRARDTRLDRDVAIKVLPGNLARDPAALARFEVEAKAMAALSHPNIVDIHEFGSEGGITFAVVELLEGETLRRRLQRLPFPWREALDYAAQMARGLSAAHYRGIAHRDLKPDNVVITTDGYVKILDFGIATVRRAPKAGPSDELDTTLLSEVFPGTIIGTAGYMSPEQARGEGADFRSDIFALGTILYEMLSGSRAFAGGSLVETLHSVIHDHPLDSRPLTAGVPRVLEDIIRHCIEKDPNRRFQSAQDAISAMEAVLAVTDADAARLGTGLKIEIGHKPPSTYNVSPGQSIAVLPFTNMSADPENEYFADGVTEEIINALTQIKGLRVVARTSSFSFKGKPVDLVEVGHKLNVEVVLEGSVRKSDDRIRITAQLIKVSDGYHLWSQQYDRTMGDIFAIQEEIAAAIAHKMEVTLSGQEKRQIVRPSTGNLEAYDLYLLGRFAQEQRGHGIQRSLEYFEQALALDPNFARAHAGCADAYTMLGLHGYKRPHEIMPKAKQSALRALEIDDKLGEAHCSLGFVNLLYDWSWSAGAAELLRAMELKPNYTPARYWYSYYYLQGVKGHIDEAIAMALRTRELDPLSSLPAISLSLTYFSAGRGEEAVEVGQEALPRDPNSFMIHRVIGLGYMISGEFAKAFEYQEKAVTLSGGHPWPIIELALAHVLSGDHAYAEGVQREVLEKAKYIYIPGVYLSLIPIVLGRHDEAMRHLEQAVRDRDPLLMTMRHWPIVEPILADIRFQNVMKIVGVE